MSSNAYTGQHQHQHKGHTGCRGCGLPWLHIPPLSPSVVYRDDFHKATHQNKSLLLELFSQPDTEPKVELHPEPPLVPCLLAAAKELKSRGRQQDECFPDSQHQAIDAIPWSRLRRSAGTPSSLRHERDDEEDRIEISSFKEMQQPTSVAFAHPLVEDNKEKPSIQASSQILYNTAFLGSPGDVATERLVAAARYDTKVVDSIASSLERPESPVERIVTALSPRRALHDDETSYQAAYASVRQERIKNGLVAHSPTLHLERRSFRRQNSSSSHIREAILSHIRSLLAAYGRFSDRDVIVNMLARSFQEPPGVTSSMWPRFEVLVLGEEAPSSACCKSPLTIYFDIAKGMWMSCSNGSCEQPLLYSGELANDMRLRLWGRWIRLNGGMLPPTFANRMQHADLASRLRAGRSIVEDLSPLHLVPLADNDDELEGATMSFSVTPPNRVLLEEQRQAKQRVEVLRLRNRIESEDSASTLDEIVHGCNDSISNKRPASPSPEPSSERSVSSSRTPSKFGSEAAQAQYLSRSCSPDNTAKLSRSCSPDNTAKSRDDFPVLTDKELRVAVAFDELHTISTEEDHRVEVEKEDVVQNIDGADGLAEVVRDQLGSKSGSRFQRYTTRERFSTGSTESKPDWRNKFNTAETQRTVSLDSICRFSKQVDTFESLRINSLDSLKQYMPEDNSTSFGDRSSQVSPLPIDGQSRPRSPGLKAQDHVNLAAPPLDARRLREEGRSAREDADAPPMQASGSKVALMTFQQLFLHVRERNNLRASSSRISDQDSHATSPITPSTTTHSPVRQVRRSSGGRASIEDLSPRQILEDDVPGSRRSSPKAAVASPVIMDGHGIRPETPLSGRQKNSARWRFIPAPAHAQVKRRGVDFSFPSALVFANPRTQIPNGPRRPATAKGTKHGK